MADVHLRRSPLAEQAAEVLAVRVTSGVWTVGEKLPGETTLATELGVGRSTIREAIRTLVGKGMLQSRQGAGVFVSSAAPAADADALLAAVQSAAILHVIEVRNALEIEAARMAAERRTPADVRRMRDALRRRSSAALGDDEEFVDADVDLHRAVVAAAHNPVLAELFDVFRPRLRQAMLDLLTLRDLRRAEPDHGAGEHLELVEAIAAGDGALAERVSRDHLEQMARAVA
ncbi:FadR family transcriptional regulator [Rhodococcus sp. D2-41]|uniref:FadR family transcriptional regulator n=1 Tax=Speluncibacter jeojiensis TaxID=2710754 RepID=A0A9X4MAW4_9ACTN|nr:FadR/GntR family transcriptional regulator [Rhodococcus sp. D2-41]MDG3010333.1 FadR family transcriptional regulator [Rhodococcus sp. D2-41]MDG3017191.1 FadR family transcriptional regulator [Corynebacteriales bacterium D3-21]